jgi:uracil-DNA glycosylase family 4
MAETEPAPLGPAEPDRDCPYCPRLVVFREEWRAKEPTWHNAPVATFGPLDARLLIVGLAPGLRGANRTGRPFTGDYAGILLYKTMLDFGFARGTYEARPDDGLMLVDAAISNGVRCVPPENKPLPIEIATCRQFLTPTIAAMTRVTAILCLGRIAHETTLAALGAKRSAAPFSHGARHAVAGYALFDSFHCSRYNTNTGRLTEDMFRSVFAAIRAFLDGRAQGFSDAIQDATSR